MQNPCYHAAFSILWYRRTQRQTCFSAELQGSTQQELNQSGLEKGCMELRLSAQACQCSPCWRIEPHSTTHTHTQVPSRICSGPPATEFTVPWDIIPRDHTHLQARLTGSSVPASSSPMPPQQMHTEVSLRVPQSRFQKGPTWGFRDSHAKGLLFSNPLSLQGQRKL